MNISRLGVAVCAVFLLGFVAAPVRAQPVTGGWENLGGAVSSRPECVSWGPTHIDCYARGAQGDLRHVWWNGSGWSQWESLGGNITSPPECVVRGLQRLHCFARGDDNALWRIYYNDGVWSTWESLDGILTGDALRDVISCAVRHPRTGDSSQSDAPLIDCFARGTDGALWRRAWDGGNWLAWESLEGYLTTSPECVASGMRLDCYVRGEENALWRRTSSGGGWTQWENLGGHLVSQIACTSTGSAPQIDCFARLAADGALWRRPLYRFTGRPWEPVGGSVYSGFTCVNSPQSGLNCFAISQDYTMWRRQLRDDRRGWTEQENLGGRFSQSPECIAVGAVRIDCFARGFDGALHHRWWDGSMWRPTLPDQQLSVSQ